MRRALLFLFSLAMIALPAIGLLATPVAANEAACDAALDPVLTFDGTNCVLSVALVKSGSFTLPAGHGLRITGTGSIDASAGGIALTIPGDLVMEGGAQIKAPGKPVTIVVGGGFTMANAAAITTSTSASGVAGGAITIAVGDCEASPPTGDVNLAPGSSITANSAKSPGGAIVVNGCHAIEADGLIESFGGTSGTGATQAPGGGPVTLDAGCDLTVSDAGIVRSKGIDPGADLVHLEGGCTVLINGLVESVGVAHGAPNSPHSKCDNTYHPDKPAAATTCVEIWAGDHLVIDSTPPHNGEVSADHVGQCGGLGWIDVFARGDIRIIGESQGAFAIHSNNNCANTTMGGTITVKSVEDLVAASGRAIAADAAVAGGSGGRIAVEAALSVSLDTATLTALGDFVETGGYGSGGRIGSGAVPGIRAFQGAVTWKSGVGDVRPTGTDNVGTVLAAAARGEIVIQDCAPGSSDVSGSQFPNQGAPATAPVILGDTCAGQAPTLASYVNLPPCLCRERQEACPVCDGTELLVTSDVKVDFNPVKSGGAPVCTDNAGPNGLCSFATYDTSGATPDLWTVIFDVGAKKLIIKDNAQVTTGTVPATGSNRAAPGVVIRGTCELVIEGDLDANQKPGGVVVTSSNMPAGNIVILFQGSITIDGIVRNQVLGTNGRPGAIVIASCCGDIVTGAKSRIETLGADPGGNDITITTCCERGYDGAGGDIVINGIVQALYKQVSQGGKTPTINIVAFNGAVTVNGTNDFGLESGVRRTSGVLVRATSTTATGDINIQAFFNVDIIGNRILQAGQVQFGAVAVKSNNTNGQGGDGDIKVVSQTGAVNASDRAIDFEQRFNALNAVTVFAQGDVNLTVTAAIDNGAATNAKPVVNSRGGSAGKGGTNTVQSFAGKVTVGANAQVLANAVGGQPGVNVLTSCGAAVKSGTVNPIDVLGDDAGVCVAGPPALFTSCEESFGIAFDHGGD
jgi:hypothetical protein